MPEKDPNLTPSSKIFSRVSYNEVAKPYISSSHLIHSRSDPKAIRMAVKKEKENKSQVKESARAILNVHSLKDMKFKGQIRDSK